MKKQFRFNSALLRSGVRVCICFLLGMGLAAKAQETVTIAMGARAPGGTNYFFRTTGQAGVFFINGSDIGTILLKACDLDQDGKLTISELKAVAAASFKLWDTNADGSLSQSEFSAALKEFFPAPQAGAAHGMRVVNGVVETVSVGELPTPDAVLAKHIFAGADANKDGLLTLQEINDFLDKSFVSWDQDGSGSLNAEELNTAFGQLSLPDEALTAPAR